MQVAAAAGAANCPPRTLDAITTIEARAKSLNTSLLPAMRRPGGRGRLADYLNARRQ
jgi:hypothetical protein